MEHIQIALQMAKQQQGLAPVVEQPKPRLEVVKPALWDRLSLLRSNADALERGRLVSLSRSDNSHVAFDMMRTRVLQLMRANNWTTVAITSPTAGCGKTTVSLNLTFSLANQQDCRTLLVDLDLRKPQIAKTLGIHNPPRLENFLKGQSEIEDVFQRHSENVAIAPNSSSVRLAAELLQSAEAAKALKGLKQKLEPDIIILDLPPMLSTDDVMAVLPSVDCVILVAAAEATTRSEIDLCELELSQKSKVLGVVLNKCRYSPEKYGY